MWLFSIRLLKLELEISGMTYDGNMLCHMHWKGRWNTSPCPLAPGDQVTEL
jgi:hypothetical protein